MSTIDIKKNYRIYSPEDLRSYAYSGIIFCGSTDLTDFLEYIFQDAEFNIEERLDKAREEGYDTGFAEGVNTGGYFDLDDCK